MISLSSKYAAPFVLGLAGSVPGPHAMAEPITISESATPFDTAGARLPLGPAPIGSAAPYTQGHDTVSFVGLPVEQGVVIGSLPSVYTVPAIDSAGDAFAGKYLSVGNSGYINIAFSRPEQALSLLWGSLDLGNRVTFLDGTTVVGVVTGADIQADTGGLLGIGESGYVLLNSFLKFNDVELSSSVQSFEVAAIRTDPRPVPVHEPSSLALMGSGLLGLIGLMTFRGRA